MSLTIESRGPRVPQCPSCRRAAGWTYTITGGAMKCRCEFCGGSHDVVTRRPVESELEALLEHGEALLRSEFDLTHVLVRSTRHSESTMLIELTCELCELRGTLDAATRRHITDIGAEGRCKGAQVCATG